MARDCCWRTRKDMRPKIYKLVGLLLVPAFSFCGCSIKREYTWGDFKYKIWSDWCEITGLSDEGAKKRVLVIPEEINGYPVLAVMDRGIGGIYGTDWESEVLESVYFPYDMEIYNGTFNKCEKLKKIFILKVEPGDYLGYLCISGDRMKTYISQYDYSALEDKQQLLAANITYYYNYERSPNDGGYWLDNLKSGEKITYIPEDPIRERWTFGGWYKEPECINAWDFEIDTVEKSNESSLYAKWI